MEIRNFSFENLDAYGKIRELIKNVYRLQNCFPKEERFGLGDQLRRAVVSVSANLAEGSGRNSLKEKIHFVEISYGSLMEVLSQLQIAMDLRYITQEQYEAQHTKIENLSYKLYALRRSFITPDNKPRSNKQLTAVKPQ